MKFIFTAKTESGQERDGVVEAMSRDAAVLILQKNNLSPVTLKEESKEIPVMRGVLHFWEGVAQKDLMVFFRQLSTLIGARVPVVSSLATIAEQSDNRYLRLVIMEIADDVEDGMSFSEALEKHPNVFTELTINMIHSGEVSGNLQKSIEFVADNIEKNYKLTSQIRGAIFYPAFVLTVATIIGFIVVTWILPKLTQLIKDLDVAIPWYTMVLMWFGDFMNAYWWAVALGIIVAIGGVVYYIKTDAGRREWNAIIFKIPIVGELAKYVYLTRFAENLAALLNGGIPVVRALIIVSNVTGNDVIKKVILRAAEEVRSGGAMSTVFVRSPMMPAIVSQMVRIGEESGTLSSVLDSVAAFYRQEVEQMTKNMTSLIEPVLIVILGIGVAIMVIGILLPIYDVAGKL